MADAITIIDAHVHIHPKADAAVLLDSAARNLGSAAKSLGFARWLGVLMLAEMRGVHWFDAAVQGSRIGRWSIEPVAGDEARLHATTADGESLDIVAGRQVVTREGVEVLTLATRQVTEDGRDFDATLDSAASTDGVTVLPWGVGKWLGPRGGLVSSATSMPNVRLGDNGGRPTLWPTPRVFSARALISGTDPLPLAGEERRVGTFGIWLRETPGPAFSTPWLRERLNDSTPQTVRNFGRLQSVSRFVWNQTALRLKKQRNVK